MKRELKRIHLYFGTLRNIPSGKKLTNLTIDEVKRKRARWHKIATRCNTSLKQQIKEYEGLILFAESGKSVGDFTKEQIKEIVDVFKNKIKFFSQKPKPV